MMFMRHISLCIILQLVHTENCADLKNVEFAGSNYSDFFYLFHSKCSSQKKKKLLWTGSVGKLKKKLFFLFLGSGPKIGSVGTWETDNQLDVPLYMCSRMYLHVLSDALLHNSLKVMEGPPPV